MLLFMIRASFFFLDKANIYSLIVCPDYNPEVDDELLRPIGELVPDEISSVMSA